LQHYSSLKVLLRSMGRPEDSRERKRDWVREQTLLLSPMKSISTSIRWLSPQTMLARSSSHCLRMEASPLSRAKDLMVESSTERNILTQ
jgi:hypothetical protein